MAKLVILNLDGDLATGFRVSLEIKFNENINCSLSIARH